MWLSKIWNGGRLFIDKVRTNRFYTGQHMCGYCVSVIGRYLLIKSPGRFIDRALIATYFCPCAAKFPLLGINKASSSLWTLILEQLNQQFSRLEAFIITSEVNRVTLFVTSWSYWSDWMFWSQLFPFCSSQREGTNNVCFRFQTQFGRLCR